MIDSRARNHDLTEFVALKTDDIREIAHLARLGVDEQALESLTADLSSMLDLVEQLQAVNTDGVEPMAHPASASLWLRDDVVVAHEPREALQAPAPSTKDGYFLVPRVIE